MLNKVGYSIIYFRGVELGRLQYCRDTKVGYSIVRMLGKVCYSIVRVLRKVGYSIVRMLSKVVYSIVSMLSKVGKFQLSVCVLPALT